MVGMFVDQAADFIDGHLAEEIVDELRVVIVCGSVPSTQLFQ